MKYDYLKQFALVGKDGAIFFKGWAIKYDKFSENAVMAEFVTYRVINKTLDEAFEMYVKALEEKGYDSVAPLIAIPSEYSLKRV